MLHFAAIPTIVLADNGKGSSGISAPNSGLVWPFPWPRPNWLAEEVSGIDLVVMATQFDQAANATFNRELRQNLVDASARLVQAGLSKMHKS